jgi:hypothetical protein
LYRAFLILVEAMAPATVAPALVAGASVVFIILFKESQSPFCNFNFQVRRMPDGDGRPTAVFVAAWALKKLSVADSLQSLCS